MYKIFGHYLPRSLIYLCLTESLIFLVCVYTGIQVAGRGASTNAPIQDLPDIMVFAGAMLISMLAMGLYRRDLRESFTSVIQRLCVSLLLGAGLLYLYFILSREELHKHVPHFTAVACAFVCVIFCRYIWHKRDAPHVKRVLVMGDGHKARRLESLRRNVDRAGIDIVGYITMENSTEPSAAALPLLKQLDGDTLNLAEFISRHRIDEVVIALDDQRNLLPTRAIMEVKLRGAHIIDINTFLERQMGKIDLNTFQTSNFIFSDGFSSNPMRSFIKRLMDVVVSGMLLMAALPVMALAALAIWVESGCRGTIIYRQQRNGLNNRVFNIIKFRSMRENAEHTGAPVWAATDDPRVTRVGHIIRKTRIDELPQLINVLRGDMSLVGPRPERPQFTRELNDMIPLYSLRACVKPGITGWAQICYPYGASVRDAGEKLQFDLYYIKHQNIFLDLLILLQTTAVIFLCKGAR